MLKIIFTGMGPGSQTCRKILTFWNKEFGDEVTYLIADNKGPIL